MFVEACTVGTSGVDSAGTLMAPEVTVVKVVGSEASGTLSAINVVVGTIGEVSYYVEAS